MITDGLQQIAEERAFGVPRLVLALRMVAGHFRVLAREQQSHILDRAGLVNARWSIDERTGDPIAQAACDQLIECFDRGRRQAVIAGDEWMQRRINRTRELLRHGTSHANDRAKKTWPVPMVSLRGRTLAGGESVPVSGVTVVAAAATLGEATGPGRIPPIGAAASVRIACARAETAFRFFMHSAILA